MGEKFWIILWFDKFVDRVCVEKLREIEKACNEVYTKLDLRCDELNFIESSFE